MTRPFAISPQIVNANVEAALAEDIGQGDVSADLIPAEAQAVAKVISREAAVIAGRPWFDAVFQRLDPHVQIHWQVVEGQHLPAEALLCTLRGNARALLSGERSALNFLQTLSGTATTVHRYVQRLHNKRVTLLDTRKTLPGLRAAQKYAVRCGGGSNHRLGLYDALLIKENHIHAAGSIAKAVTQARTLHPGLPLEVEVEDMAQLQQALDSKVERILLDNMSKDQLRAAVRLNDGRATLEASGNITLDNIADIAATGIDAISIGSLTKHLHAIDLSMRFLGSGV